MQKTEGWNETYVEIKKCITGYCWDIWKERNEIWSEERRTQREQIKTAMNAEASETIEQQIG